MRHFIATFIILIVCSPFVKAQENTPVADSTTVEHVEPCKFAHVDLEAIVELMPEYATTIENLEKVAAEYDKELEQMENEYSEKYDTYIAQRASLTPQIAKRREDELVALQQEITGFTEIARKEMAQVQRTAITTVYDKATKVIKEIGAEYAYTYVFDISERKQTLPLLAYFGEESQDITPLVKELLGIAVEDGGAASQE